jgi:regulator of protease activity HflC (stomatin/prohibitin superfamily)
MNIADLFGLIAGAAWLLALVILVVMVVRASRNQPVKGVGTAVLVVFGIAVILSVVSAGIVFIQPEQRGVVISAVQAEGYRPEPLQPGLRWVIPFAETVVLYPISKQTYTMSIAAGEGQIYGDDSVAARTSDGQEIFLDASVIYSIDPARIVDVHIAWQSRYADDLVRPLARGIIRDAVSQYGVEQVVSSKRFELVQLIRAEMEKKMTDNGLILVDFVLRNITFSPEYAASVEQKQIAEQQAQQAKFVVESKKQEAEQARQVAQGQADAAVIAAQGAAEARLIEAEAEAKALELIAKVLAANPNLLTYEYIQKLAPNIQIMLVPNDNPFLLPLPTPNTPIPQ